jgi:hypothetical protein
LFPANIEKQVKGLRKGSDAIVKRWVDSYSPAAKRLFYEAKYSEFQYKLLAASMERVTGQTPLVLQGGVGEILGVPIKAKDELALFLRVDPPIRSKIGFTWEFDVLQRDSKTRRILGGSRYRVVINRPVRK